jgi:hypothetical protein
VQIFGDAIGSNVFRRVTLKNQAGHLLPVRQNKFCSDGIAIRSLFDFRGAAEILRSLGHQEPWTEKPSVVDGRQRTNCSAALCTTHRKQAEQRFHQTGN